MSYPDVRSVQELTSVDPPFWPTLRGWVEASPRPVRVLPPPTRDRGQCLHRLQVTTRSPLGAMAWETGGLLLDDGWIRLLGGGSDDLPDIAAASGMGDREGFTPAPSLLVVGHDVLGGTFALNGGALDTPMYTVSYFAPDLLEWDACGELAYGEFVRWALTGDVERFYDGLRWPGWRQEVAGLSPADGIHVYPPLFSREGREPGAASRTVVPVAELFIAQRSAAEQLSAVGPGESFEVRVVNVPGSGPAEPGPNRSEQ